MLERNFDLSDLSNQLPNHTYSTKYVYVKDVPRIDQCVYALFIVPEMSGQSEPSVTISNAHFFMEFTLEEPAEYEGCDNIDVTLFLGNVKLVNVTVDYYSNGLSSSGDIGEGKTVNVLSCLPSTSDNL